MTNTFKPQMLRARKAKWRKEQDARHCGNRANSWKVKRHAAAWARRGRLMSIATWPTRRGEKLQVALANYMPFGTQLPFGGQGSLGTHHHPFPPCRVISHRPTSRAGGTPRLDLPNPPPPSRNPANLPEATPLTFPQPPLTFPATPVGLPATPTGLPTAPDLYRHYLARPRSLWAPALIIHHAQMVQLGVNNHMWNQRGTQAPEDQTRETE